MSERDAASVPRPELTPSQTVGPYLSLGMTWPDGHLVVPEDTPGAIVIVGRVTDGAGDGVGDGVVETWQVGPDGRFAGCGATGFRGFGRCLTSPDGSYRIVTVKPGPTGTGDAPHIDVSVLARGLLDRLVTRIYFPDEEIANAADPLLAQLPGARRRTVVAVAEGPSALRFDIRLQGADETVFLDL